MAQIVLPMNKLKRRTQTVDEEDSDDDKVIFIFIIMLIYNYFLTCCLNKVSYSSHSNSSYIKRCLFIIGPFSMP